ncbi:hypothetical protein GDO81_002700 [Engystomops pustulosus]|uniref:WH2 domain-containing protein n=1 Tax=Engystomops pustulosus TaxID=76066 RepID=A0AAV7DQ61_ENGPU|nr:hypothetical protein GDO81_002700 [Engystomops pustulosus]
MSFSLEDTLEADWVAVRPNVFEEKERHKFVFIVAWNEVEGKFAITCHNRTAQRQRSADKGGSPGGRREASPGGSPARDQEDEDCSWAGLFSFQDLRSVHQQLCSVSAELEPCLPAFPEEPSGMWSVLFGAPELSEEQVEELCGRLQRYLGHALDTCGWKILSQVLFTETDDPEEYYESLSELRHKGYEEALLRARRGLHELLEKHKATENMVDLLQVYQMEDEAYNAVVEATTEFYQYLLQPFRDMRELAMLRRQQIKISIENDYLGPRRIESLKKEDADWQKKAHMAVLSIQDLTIKYFEITAKAQKAVFDRMRADQKKFGKTTWTTAVERMEKLQYGVSKETLQLMRAKEICLEQKKHALKEESLHGGTEAIAVLDQLEADYYDHQLQLYEVQFEILKCEELLLTAQLESIKRQISEKRDEVVYYDTYESMEAMLATEDMAASIHLQREELHKLQLKLRQLEAKRGRISAKKAYLRNKKEICIAKNSEKMQQRPQTDEQYRLLHHTAQIARDKQQDEEDRKSTWVTQERQKTFDILWTSTKNQLPTLTHEHLKLMRASPSRYGVLASPPPPPPPPPLSSTSEEEASPRMSSPMDEVLASLKRGSFHLKKVEQRTLAPFPDEDESNNILAQIRKGVKLKKVQKDVLKESFTLLPDTDPLTRSIHEALRRIKEASPESEDEEESLPCTDWEN